MKKISIVIFSIMSWVLLMGNVYATDAQTLIQKQNPNKLTVKDNANAKCTYKYNRNDDCTAGIDTAFGNIAPFPISGLGGAVITIDKSEFIKSPEQVMMGVSLFLDNDVWYCPDILYGNLEIYIEDNGYVNGDLSRPMEPTKRPRLNFAPAPSGEYCKVHLQNPDSVRFFGQSQYADEGEDYYGGSKGTWVCGGFVSDKLLKEINKIYRTLSLGVVVVVIILGVLDFIKAIGSDDDSALKKSASKFMKRIVIAIIIVALPILLQFILSLFGNEEMKTCLDLIK